MRKSIIAICLLLGSVCTIQGQKYRMGHPPDPLNPAAPPLHLHITASHLQRVCSGQDIGGKFPGVGCANGLFVDAVLDGKKVQLWGDAKVGKQQNSVLAPGDYTAQLTYDKHNTDQTAVSQGYTVLLHDGTKWVCILNGIAE